ncbi:MAG: hypothetical protein LBT99_00715 [Bifidobacteriaceae bacterium]|jgi:hypothetical protein|nr:hypothetical protein [Bifidobacteriaceae bacterium]
MLKNSLYRVISVFTLIVLCVSGLSACSGGLGSASEPPLGEIKTITDSSQISRPIDKYVPSTDEVLDLYNALGKRMNNCFKQNGVSGNFSYFKNDKKALEYFQQDINIERDYYSFYGFFNVKKAAKFGYKKSATGNMNYADRDGKTYSNPDDPEGSLTEESNETNYPVKANSPLQKLCIDDVKNAAPLDTGGYFDSLFSFGGLPDGGPIKPESDSRYKEVVDKWSDCVKQKGYQYSTPKDVFNHFLKDWNAANDLEKATAVADVQCKIQTNLVGVAVAVQSAYDEQYIDSHREALAAWRQTLDDYIAGK